MKEIKNIQTDGHIYHVLVLEESFLWKSLYHPKQLTDSIQFLSNYQWYFSQNYSIQFLSNYQWYFSQNYNKKFHNFHGNTKTSNSQSNLDKWKWNWKNQHSWLQTKLQNYSHQDTMVLAQKQKCRPMEQERKLRGKPTNLCAPYVTKETRLYNGEKIASSISGAGKTGQLYVNGWNYNTS